MAFSPSIDALLPSSTPISASTPQWSSRFEPHSRSKPASVHACALSRLGVWLTASMRARSSCAWAMRSRCGNGHRIVRCGARARGDLAPHHETRAASLLKPACLLQPSWVSLTIRRDGRGRTLCSAPRGGSPRFGGSTSGFRYGTCLCATGALCRNLFVTDGAPESSPVAGCWTTAARRGRQANRVLSFSRPLVSGCGASVKAVPGAGRSGCLAADAMHAQLRKGCPEATSGMARLARRRHLAGASSSSRPPKCCGQAAASPGRRGPIRSIEPTVWAPSRAKSPGEPRHAITWASATLAGIA